MKLLTLNTHSLIDRNYSKHLEFFCDAVAKIKPDIIALQEVNQTSFARKAERPKNFTPCGSVALRESNHALKVYDMLKNLGICYNFTWAGVKNGYKIFDEGLSVFSLAPIEKAELIYLSKSHNYADWRTRAALLVKSGENYFCSVHFGWWEDKKEPFLHQWESLYRHLDFPQNVFLMGDFNCPADVRGEGYDRVLADGFFDTYTLSEKKDDGFTIRGKIAGWENAKKTESQRIDYIFSREKCVPKSSFVIFDGKNFPMVSDHFGIVTDF